MERNDPALDALGCLRVKLPAFDEDVWELYDGSKDWTQANDSRNRSPRNSGSCSASG